MIVIRFRIYRAARALGLGVRRSVGVAMADDPFDALAAARFVQTGTFADHVWHRRDAGVIHERPAPPCFACLGMHRDHAPGCPEGDDEFLRKVSASGGGDQ